MFLTGESGVLVEKHLVRAEIASFCGGFGIRIYRRAVVVAFLEVLWSLRGFDRLIVGSIVSQVKVLFAEA